MARKVVYSQPLKFFWKELYAKQKKLAPYLTDEQVFIYLKSNILNAPLSNGETLKDRGLTISGLELWRKDSVGELLHIFFLDKELKTFLEDTKLSDLEGIKKFLYEEGEIKQIFRTYSNTETEHFAYDFALHVPNEADGYAFSLFIEEDNSIELHFSHGKNGGRMSEKFYKDLSKKYDTESLIILKMFRLALNTIAYMSCFPDCVADGVPKDIFEKHIPKANRNISFEISEKIKDIEASSISKIPHFRRGHFRLLESDYFTNKKGQVIFISETIVKAKAKTVLSTPNKNNLK